MADIIIGIDTGGTFTDGFFADGSRIEKIKVDTTPHDLTVCFMNCLNEGAKAFGYGELRSFLKEVRVLRFSSTTSTNAFVQRIGAKIGLMVTRGFEDNLYENNEENRLPDFLLSRSMVEGIEEEVDPTGEVLKFPNEADILDKMKRLLERGARIIVVSLHNAHLNSNNERKVKEIVGMYYPRHYLGSLPIILAGQFCNHPDEAGRTNLAVVNAYVHPSVAGALYHAEDKLRESSYSRPLLMVDSTGGCSRVAKTKAVELMRSVLAAGYKGAAYWAERYNQQNVVTIDIGGTSSDIGIIVDSGVFYQKKRGLFGIHVATPALEVSSIGLGGGSIAKPDMGTKQIKVGPESAGALPGPACYDLGGQKPTVTDANVVLNRINPDYFLGGRRKLNTQKAYESIGRVVGDPLGLSAEKAAWEIVERAAELAAEAIQEMIAKLGKSADQFVMFAYGGAGGAHCCEIAERLGISKIYVYPFSATFGAFGTSMMDLTHTYMRYKRLPLLKEGELVLDMDAFNSLVLEEQKKAYRDMIGEGFAREDVNWALDLEIIGRLNGHRTLVTSPKVLLNSMEDVRAILNNYESEKVRLGSSGEVGNNLHVDVFYLKACCPLFKYEFPRFHLEPLDPSHALKGVKEVLGEEWPRETKIYSFELLECGNIVVGPSIIESSDTTIVIPKGWRFSIDEYLNGIMEKPD